MFLMMSCKYREVPNVAYKIKITYQKELGEFTSGWKPVRERQRAKPMSKSEVNERETFTHWEHIYWEITLNQLALFQISTMKSTRNW
jgi:hypothetical protein